MGEVAKRIVADVRIDRRARQQRTGAAEQQRVAVRLGAGGLEATDRAGAAGDVLDIELLLEGVGHLGGQHACKQVGGASGRKGDDDLDRLCRPVLRIGCERACANQDNEAEA
jgi:hypothetical protein